MKLLLFNYDFMLDYTFHQNGAVEVCTYLYILHRTRALGLTSTSLEHLCAQAGITLIGYVHTGFEPAPGPEAGRRVLFGNSFGLIHPHLFHFRVDLDVNGASWRLRASYRSCSMLQVFGGAFHTGFDGEFRRTQSRRASGPRGEAQVQLLLAARRAARHVAADAERAARGARVSRALRVPFEAAGRLLRDG